MGAADVVPGVSGGTIAFITGIYEELIDSLANLNLGLLKTLRNNGLKSFWKELNGNFFVALFFGIGISVFSLAKLLTYLLDTFPVLLWSFFFGLVLASAILIIKSLPKWTFKDFVGLIIGTAIAAFISSIQTTGDNGSLGYIFISGVIAICAMILPGISGAFILVLLGSYATIIQGIKDLNILLIAVFFAGCFVGLISFSKLLKFLFSKFKNLILATLTGFLFGSLFKIWPWKNEDKSTLLRIHSDGSKEFASNNVLPHNFEGTPDILLAILIFAFGLGLVLFIDFISKRGHAK